MPQYCRQCRHVGPSKEMQFGKEDSREDELTMQFSHAGNGGFFIISANAAVFQAVCFVLG